MRRVWWFLWLMIGVVGCTGGSPTAVPPIPSPSPPPTITPEPPESAPPPPPTLVPTFTPIPTQIPIILPTLPPPPPPDATSTPIPFDEMLVDVQLTIPGLALDRRLTGDVAGHIRIEDAKTGAEAQYNNQSNVLLELRLGLTDLELEPVPEGCDFCVQLRYELGLTEASGAGWLQDEALLASLENYFAVTLGPHFPPDTLVGLRRSASQFAPAHTIAITGDGRFWSWLASSGEISEPAVTAATQPVLAQLISLPVDSFSANYTVRCHGVPVETLIINQAGQTKKVSIVCPEFSLPSTLQPLYLQLDALTKPLLAEVSLPRPQAAFSLTAVLDYRRFDGVRMTLHQDGTAVVISRTQTITSVVSVEQMRGLTAVLWDSGAIEPGLTTFGSPITATVSSLALRGPGGVYDGQWPPGIEFTGLTELDALLDSFLTALLPDGE